MNHLTLAYATFNVILIILLDKISKKCWVKWDVYISGYRCFKASMFLTGFTFGSAIVYLICLQEYLMPPYGNVGEYSYLIT